MYKSKNVLSILLLSLLFVNLLGVRAQAKDFSVIHVEGRSSIKVKPDHADLVISSLAEDSSPGGANRKNNLKMNRIIKELKKKGLGEDKIETIDVGVRPIIDYSEEKPKNKGYLSRNTISIRIDDLKALEGIIDLCLDKGADRVDYISYGHSDEAKIYEKALKQAFIQAKSKADALAQAASLEIKGIGRIEESSIYVPYESMENTVMDSDALTEMETSSASINIRDIEINGSITVEFIY